MTDGSSEIKFYFLPSPSAQWTHKARKFFLSVLFFYFFLYYSPLRIDPLCLVWVVSYSGKWAQFVFEHDYQHTKIATQIAEIQIQLMIFYKINQLMMKIKWLLVLGLKWVFDGERENSRGRSEGETKPRESLSN